jgi:hypothetical protein
MKIICAWCGKDLGSKPPLTNPNISHGMCDACETVMNKELDAADKALQTAPQQSARNTWFIPALCLAFLVFGGCRGVDRLLNGPSDQSTQLQTPSIGPAPLGDAPSFNVDTPAGFDRTVLYGYMPANGVVVVPAATGAQVRVFLKDLSINQWFKLGINYSEAFYYSFDGSEVTYKGKNLNNLVYCVYFYAPK